MFLSSMVKNQIWRYKSTEKNFNLALNEENKKPDVSQLTQKLILQ